MASTTNEGPTPEGIFSLLDTDLYKLTMQSAVLKYFPTVDVTYSFTNRTADMKFNRTAFEWLHDQIHRLEHITIKLEEIEYLRKSCPYLSEAYFSYLSSFRLRPSTQIRLFFIAEHDTGGAEDQGNIELHTKGRWVETILYEIPLLALTSEAYFKFCDKDWTHEGQVEKAREKGLRLLQEGCMVSEFGSRRRRDYRTHGLVLEGLLQAQKTAEQNGWKGKVTGTSNVHFAMRFGIPPVGTVAHEWFMGVAAVTESYKNATEAALAYWIGTFGKGILSIALTDTFGTPSFLKAFRQRIPKLVSANTSSLPSMASNPGTDSADSISCNEAPISATVDGLASEEENETFAQVFNGVRQDSGNPLEFVKIMREFYDREGIKSKTIVFSDSLNVERCIEYKRAAEEAGFNPSFGVGTFFTNDFSLASNTSKKSVPLNIVIKLSSADGKPAIKISDNLGKNTGDSATVAEVKRELGYVEKEWSEGDESKRW